MEEHQEQSGGFVARWVMPIAFIVVVVGLLWFLGRISVPMLGPESEMPEDHMSGGCSFCHRAEAGFDPATLSAD